MSFDLSKFGNRQAIIYDPILALPLKRIELPTLTKKSSNLIFSPCGALSMTLRWNWHWQLVATRWSCCVVVCWWSWACYNDVLLVCTVRKVVFLCCDRFFDFLFIFNDWILILNFLHQLCEKSKMNWLKFEASCERISRLKGFYFCCVCACWLAFRFCWRILV